MMVLISYDVSTMDNAGRTRLRKVAKECQNHAQRDRLVKLIDPGKDSLRFYYLGNHWKKRVEHIGAKETYDPEGVIII